jgi:hypothetical protein
MAGADLTVTQGRPQTMEIDERTRFIIRGTCWFLPCPHPYWLTSRQYRERDDGTIEVIPSEATDLITYARLQSFQPLFKMPRWHFVDTPWVRHRTFA